MFFSFYSNIIVEALAFETMSTVKSAHLLVPLTDPMKLLEPSHLMCPELSFPYHILTSGPMRQIQKLASD